MATQRNQPQTVLPTLTHHQALTLVKRQLKEMDSLFQLHRKDVRLKQWESTTQGILEGAFGKPNGQDHRITYDFLYGGVGAISLAPEPESYYVELHEDDMKHKQAVLKSCIEQLELLAPPSASVAPGQYVFHSEIERVSGQLFRDGHYRQAVLDAYIRVIEAVRVKSGLPHDGDKLMNHAFGTSTNPTAVIKFNNLSTDSEKDEQLGFMYLFKGLTALRNSKAHAIRVFNDPIRAHDYLSLASLLMRALDDLVVP